MKEGCRLKDFIQLVYLQQCNFPQLIVFQEHRTFYLVQKSHHYQSCPDNHSKSDRHILYQINKIKKIE